MIVESLLARRIREGKEYCQAQRRDKPGREARLAALALAVDQQEALNRRQRREKKARKKSGAKADWAPKERFVCRYVDDSLDLVSALLDQPRPIPAVTKALDLVAQLSLDPEANVAFLALFLLYQAARQQTPMSEALLDALRPGDEREDDWTVPEINSCIRINRQRLQAGKLPVKGEVILAQLRTGKPAVFTKEHICTVMK